MKKYRDLFPELYDFFAGSFHQDWVEDYSWENEVPTFQRVVSDFKRENPSDTVSQVTRELKQFLKTEVPENNLYKILVHDLGANINVSYYRITHQKWLEIVLNILEKN
jgi:CdiI immunity protein